MSDERVPRPVSRELSNPALVALWVAAFLCGCSSGGPAPQSTRPMPASSGSRLFVSNEIGGTVSVIDIATRQVVHTIAIGKRPRGIRASRDGNTVYVALSGSPIGGPNVDESKLPPPDRRFDGIGVIDAATGTLLRTLQGGTDPEQFTLSSDGTRLFIANEDAGLTSVLDVASGKVVQQIKVGGEPEGVDLSPDGRFVYVTSEEENRVYVIDTGTLAVAGTIDVGPRPRSTAFVASRNRAYVSSENGAAVTVVDSTTHKVVRQISLTPDTLRPMGLLTSPDDARVFVTTGRGGTLEIIDTATETVQGSVRVGERPWGLAASADGTTIFTANGPSNDVSFVDAATMEVTARVPVGDRPWGVALVPQ
jgi:YVTN family beta-propeller protein